MRRNAHLPASLLLCTCVCAVRALGHIPVLRIRGGGAAMGATCKPQEMKTKLLELGQEHLFVGLQPAQEEKLLEQAGELNSQLPGGLDAYVATARKLLKDSAEGVNPFDGFTPTVPHGECLSAGTPEFYKTEELGMQHVKHTGFVLVAGGLGERLGYRGIKIALPLYETDRKPFMQHYAEHILEMQRKSGAEMIPLAIMTSDDTHAMTVELFKDHNNFGLADGQVTFMKQNKVPALKDSSASFDSKEGMIDTKPHGHGDVHTLMHQTGLARSWEQKGIKWVCFFQDTNGIIFRALPSVIGVSATHSFDVNSVCVPRTPGEAVGGICKLEHSDGRSYTVNVEYNQLDSLLRSTEKYKGGDVADPKTGCSPFPGNINILVFGAKRYADTLDKTNGVMNEFVNPKYADASKTTFKKPTRLECMMQDFPLLLPPEAPVGFTQLDRWLCFSPVKNNLVDAAAKASSGLPPECAGTAERDAMYLNTKMLRMAGVKIPEEGPKGTYAGVPLSFAPLCVLSPAFGTCVTDVKDRMGKGADVEISASSAVLLDGDIQFEGRVHVDGALVIKAMRGAKVVVKSLEVKNKGWSLREATEDERKADEMVNMRGYKIDKHETKELVFDKAGEYTVEE